MSGSPPRRERPSDQPPRVTFVEQRAAADHQEGKERKAALRPIGREQAERSPSRAAPAEKKDEGKGESSSSQKEAGKREVSLKPNDKTEKPQEKGKGGSWNQKGKGGGKWKKKKFWWKGKGKPQNR